MPTESSAPLRRHLLGRNAVIQGPCAALQQSRSGVPLREPYLNPAGPRNGFVILGFEAEFRGAVPGSFGVRSSNQKSKANDCEIIIKLQ